MANNAVVAVYAVIVVLAVLLAIIYFASQSVILQRVEVAGTSTAATTASSPR
jgi:hypothetical protein